MTNHNLPPSTTESAQERGVHPIAFLRGVLRAVTAFTNRHLNTDAPQHEPIRGDYADARPRQDGDLGFEEAEVLVWGEPDWSGLVLGDQPAHAAAPTAELPREQ